MAQKLEIELKYLLKALPKKEPEDIIDIDQYYTKVSGKWERARTWFSEKSGDKKWIHTIKKNVSKKVNIEDEKFLTEEEYDLFKAECLANPNDSKFISKKRYIYKDGDLKWEVDEFDNGYHLIVAEIEIPEENYKVIIPDFMKDVILLDVTGLKQFSNRSLSLPIEFVNETV